MLVNIIGKNAPEAFTEGLWKFEAHAVEENTRNGKALVMPDPTLLTIYKPTERIVACPERDANPFFHLMEWVWMLAGENRVEWILQFNKNYVNYTNEGVVHGAYGYRWFELWGNQIRRVILQLRADPTTRQAVINMWDPKTDYKDNWLDRPCNTQIYFRNLAGHLDMTVINRSNDYIWGMMGANVVHMTYLQELVAGSVGMPIGKYQVFSNNLHMYKEIPNYPHVDAAVPKYDIYRTAKTAPLFMDSDDSFELLCADAYDFVRGDFGNLSTRWFKTVAVPVHDAYLDKSRRHVNIARIKAEDWYIACLEWANRRRKNVSE